MPLMPGQVLNNRYRVVKLLGQGGFGAVYKAWDLNLERPCALKENIEVSTAGQAQFFTEAKILSMLRHPGLPLVSDHFVIPGQGQYLVMDYVEGEDLNEKIATAGGRLPEANVLPWIGQVLDALVYMHTRIPPVIHRDIKPANIKITPPDGEHPQGQAVLVDFGIAKVYDPQLKTTLGARAFTPGYSPHEQYGRGTTDARTDLYALGATLYMLLTGEEPAESIQRVVDDVLLPPRQLNPAISPQTEAVILHAMQVDPRLRFQSAAEFRSALTASHQPPAAGSIAGKAGPPTINIQSPAQAPATPAYQQPVQPAPAAPAYQQSPQPAPVPQYQPKPAQPVLLTLVPGVTMEFVHVPAGEFLMGSDKAKDEEAYGDETPQHKLSLPEYLMGKYPVTVRQFAAFVKATGHKCNATNDVAKKGEHPVTLVRWDDAAAFCQWASKQTGRNVRLPSEAEWEKAARGTDGRIYPWGDQAPDEKRCNFRLNVKGTTPVGRYSPLGDSPYGCADMAGNVWEWTGSLFKPYPYNAQDGREDPNDHGRRVLRGGAFYYDLRRVRCGYRINSYPGSADANLGFRVCVFPI